MLRAILLIVALLIILAIGAVAVGLVDVTRPQQAPPGRIDVKVNDVDVGTAPTNVQMPTVGTTTKQVELPQVTIDRGGAQAPAQPAPQPAPQGNGQ
jgi:hypothetical protein